MTRRDRLADLLRQRAQAIIEITPLAKEIFPVGTPVLVCRAGEVVEAHVLSVGYGGEDVTVRLPGGDSWSYRLARLLEWNPDAGATLAGVA